MRKKSVRRLFLACFVLLPLQYALVGVVGLHTGGEPWPALVLPAFQAPDTDEAGALLETQPVLAATFADGEKTRVPVEALLAGLPASHHGAFFAEQCRPAALSGTPTTERCRHPAARRWLRERLAARYPGEAAPRRLDIVWVQLRHAPGASAPRRTALDTLSLTLGSPRCR